MSGELAIALTAALILLAVAAVVLAVRTRRVVATPTERAVHAALHTASLAARALRRGLDADSAETAAPFLRGLTGTDGLALYGGDGPHPSPLVTCQRARLTNDSKFAVVFPT